MSEPLVLAIDIGTSSCKAIVYDHLARPVPGLRAQRSYELRVEPPGAAEIDPGELAESVDACIGDALSQAGERAGEIVAVGCCAFWHSVLGVGAGAAPVSPIFTWADQRAEGASRQLAGELDPVRYHRRTGCFLHPSFLPARLRWLSERGARPPFWRSPSEWLYERFFGEAACSVSMASATGLFDTHRGTWDLEVLEAAHTESGQLSRLAVPGEVQAGLRDPFRSMWPALAEIPWVPAIGDGAASNLGSGCKDGSSIALNLGTSGAVRALWNAESFAVPDDLWVYRLDSKRPVMGAAFSDGGNLHAWARSRLALPDSDEEIERLLSHREPGSHGLTVLPFFAGERSMGWRPDARATLNGLSLATTPIDLLQAMMEAVALRFVRAVEALRREFPSASRLVASGGVPAQSASWARMLCDAIGMPLEILDDGEASSRGAALVALEAAGLREDSAQRPGGRILKPSPERAERYREMLARQEAVYRLL